MFVGLANALSVGIVVGAVAGAARGARPQGGILSAVLLIGGAQILATLVGTLSQLATVDANLRVKSYVRVQLREFALTPPTVDHLEDAQWQADVALVTSGVEIGAYAARSARWLSSLGSALAQAAFVAAFSIPLAIGALISGRVLSFLLSRTVTPIANSQLSLQHDQRRVRYQKDLANSMAREGRIFNSTPWLENEIAARFVSIQTALSAARGHAMRRTFVVIIVWFGLAAGGAWTIVRASAGGNLGVGSATALLTTLLLLIQPANNDAGLLAFDRLKALERLRDGPKAEGYLVTQLKDFRVLEFVNVSFRYGDGPVILSNLNLTLKAGQSVALVGANGSGKSTLVKLLTGLYRPTSGTIRVNGMDLATICPSAWHAQLAALFQDFLTLPMTIEENITLGRTISKEKLDPIASAVDAADFIARLPSGWQTIMVRDFAGGAELSGGEWQRVALARALVAVQNGAGILILDEPTASLDVRLEHELYQRVLSVTPHCTRVLISHRLSTVRKVERILVLEGGRITEDGSHEELIATRGTYAEMFNSQALHFADPPLLAGD